ncbi:MAG: hypothetical protein LBS93_08045 [Synergistaceae bacterium]|jgi:GGDEF domain-containing protein|nr:hypothetical protein [Synergistaceae bacterium]
MVVSDKSGGAKNNTGISRHGFNVGFLENLAFPPVALVPILIIAVLIGDTRAGSRISMPALFAMLISYAAMSIVFISLRKNSMKRAANAVSLLANGVLLLFLSFTMGLGELFAWAGTALIAGGLFTLMSQVITPPKTQFSSAGTDLLPDSIGHGEVKKLLDAMAFPSAFFKKNDDGEDIVVALNDTLTSIVGLGRNEQQARGVRFSTLLPNNDGSTIFKFADAEWIPHRTTKGRQTLFMLTPVVKTSSGSLGPTDAIDNETGLFTPLFLKYRANADVEACRRYGRKLSVVLFRVSFGKTAIVPNENAMKKAWIEFGKMVVESLRACDSGYRLREDEVLVYLPDTPQSGSKTVVNRVMDKVRKLSKVECAELASAEIEEVTINYFGDEVVSVDEVMNDMYIAMGRKKDQ